MSNEYIDRFLSWMSNRYNNLYDSIKGKLDDSDIQRLMLVLGFLFLILLIGVIYPLGIVIFSMAISFGWQIFVFCLLLAIIIFLCTFVFMIFIVGDPLPFISFSHEYITQIGGQLKSLADLIELCSQGSKDTNGEWLKDKLIMLKQARNNINMEIENTVKEILDALKLKAEDIPEVPKAEYTPKIPTPDDIPEAENKSEDPV